MITEIRIANVATFGVDGEKLTDLAKLNFLYGGNGTGKTTISRVIAEHSKFPDCSVSWIGDVGLTTMVYNADFIDRNYHQVAELKGVFTLGEEQTEILTAIELAKKDQDGCVSKIQNLTENLRGADGNSGKQGELAALETQLKDRCWKVKQRHDATFQRAFEGVRGSAEKFKARVLGERERNRADPLAIADLEKKAGSLYGEDPVPEAILPTIDAARLLDSETVPVLRKRVIGREDVDIAAVIGKLGNSDWVRDGRRYFDDNAGVCPFCQQATSDTLARSLEEYFDESFKLDTKAISDLITGYDAAATRITERLRDLVSVSSRFLESTSLSTLADVLNAKMALNRQSLSEKAKEPSRAVGLEPVGETIRAINTVVEAANVRIKLHNEMVANLKAERAMLADQIWRFVLEELADPLREFASSKECLNRAISSMSEQIELAETKKRALSTQIADLEKRTTGIQPTIAGINGLLASFGFQGFKLAMAPCGTAYRLVRPDGSEAKRTLSEGERTFVSFLYFWHLIKGSESASGVATDRIVVFDDPVSSLDSDILFIVSSLIRSLCEEVRHGKGLVKQVFVLTHNVYFHKEVTLNPSGRTPARGEIAYWVVRKSDLSTKLVKHEKNPVKTAYQLLWEEVRSPERSKSTLQNVLRRILENYFKILGGVDPNDICELFVGRDRFICKSLLSWVNDGSHFAGDDLYVATDDVTIEGYLKVFRSLFELSNHGAHYKMMMGDAYIEVA